MHYPKISIVTPSFNQGSYLEATILSVINQQYPNLEYIIIDGGSTDNSVDIIKKYEKHLAYWMSEKDNGLYHALQKGFEQSSGEIMGWINSDDLLHQQSLFVLADIFTNVPSVNWIQGYPSVFDHKGRIVDSRPPRCSKFSFYLKDYHDGIFIQQESTYWRRCLWRQAGGYISQAYKLAGDFELWIRFFRHDTLFSTRALIGGFRIRPGNQLSLSQYDSYLSEADAVINKEALSPQVVAQINKLRSYNKYYSKVPFLNRLLKKRVFWEKPAEIYFDFKKQIFVKV